MNTRLLSIIQSERERRNAPAVLEMNRKRGRESVFEKEGLGKLWIVMRGFKNAFNELLRLTSLENKSVILPTKGHKHREVENELVYAGLDPVQISKQGDRSPSFITRLKAFIVLLGSSVSGYSYFRREHTFKYFEVLFISTVLRKWLQTVQKGSAWIIIGDLSPSLISLAAACKHSGHTVVYWQYSFLDFKHLPVEADITVLLNSTGTHLANANADTPYFWRDIGTVKSVDTKNIHTGPFGVLLNVHAHKQAWKTIIDIQNAIGLPCEVRFHPNSKLPVPQLPDDIIIADKHESLESFAERISLAVCGNTQAQAKLMMSGVPVVQLKGLDLLSYDFHGYIERDIVPGIKEPADFDMDSIVSFYHSEKYKTGLFNLIGPTGENRIPSLEVFIDRLAKKGSLSEF